MTAAGVARRLGGRRTLKRDVRTDFDLMNVLSVGLPIATVDAVIESGLLSANEVYEQVVPRRTLAHRKERGQPLTPEQSDRLARTVRVIARAEEALGDAETAHRWLRRANRALRGERPIDLLDSDVGARLVESVLGRIEHGVAS